MILFFDVDGTLWDYKNYIPKSTVEGIKKAQEKGHKCFINTGRARAFVTEENLLNIGFDGIVSACGCMIEYNNEVIYNRLIDREDCIRTMEAMDRYKFKPILEGPSHLYMEREDYMDDLFGQKIMKEMGDRLLGIRDNWGKWEMNKLSVTCNPDPGITNRCYEELSDLYEYIIHTPTICEMVPRGFSKGTGIRKVCEMLGADIKDTFAFGDSVNDLEMLKEAGTAIVMGRAPENVKAAADFVTADLEDDGIWKALERFGLI